MARALRSCQSNLAVSLRVSQALPCWRGQATEAADEGNPRPIQDDPAGLGMGEIREAVAARLRGSVSLRRRQSDVGSRLTYCWLIG